MFVGAVVQNQGKFSSSSSSFSACDSRILRLILSECNYSESGIVQALSDSYTVYIYIYISCCGFKVHPKTMQIKTDSLGCPLSS